MPLDKFKSHIRQNKSLEHIVFVIDERIKYDIGFTPSAVILNPHRLELTELSYQVEVDANYIQSYINPNYHGNLMSNSTQNLCLAPYLNTWI
jgi:hypothetical protein